MCHEPEMHVCRHASPGDKHVHVKLVSKRPDSMASIMSCVSCSLQASPHTYVLKITPLIKQQ